MCWREGIWERSSCTCNGAGLFFQDLVLRTTIWCQNTMGASTAVCASPSKKPLGEGKRGASFNSLGNLFQSFTNLIVKIFLISNLNIPSFSLKPFPLVLLQKTLLKAVYFSPKL